MSWDNDRDHSDWLNGPYVRAACVDCGGDVVTDCDPDGALCEACCNQRDAHSSALQLRMAKAVMPGVSNSPIPNDVPVVVDVALVPILQPAGYLPWLDALRANAVYGSDALARAWYVSPVHYQLHLLTVAPELWITLKAIGRRAA